MLAADLRLEAPSPIPARYFDEARKRGLRSAQVLTFPTAIFSGELSQLAALNAVTPSYPLRGHVRIADAPFGVPRTTTQVPGRGEVWIDARIIAQLKLELGTALRIGAATFRVTEVLDYRPDQGTGFVNLAPAALLNYDDIASTKLVQEGSRATYAALFAGSPAAVADFREFLSQSKTPGERLRDVEDSSRQLNSAIDRAGRFLNLASLAAVLLAAVAVAMGARRYAARHIDAVALMKCMGAAQGFVLAISVIELTLLALFAVAIGTLLGYLAQSGLVWLLKSLIPSELPAASLSPLPIALVTVLAMLIGFALPPLLQLKSTPPARVLRKTVTAPPLRYGVSYLLALAALFAILWSMVRDTELVLSVLAGVLGVGVVLTLAGYALVRLTSRLRGGVGVAWRYGLANVSRRGTGSVVQIVAFGLGLMCCCCWRWFAATCWLIGGAACRAMCPTIFWILSPDQRERLREFFTSHGFGAPQMYPMVRARITAINGESPQSLQLHGDADHGYVRREQNLTSSANMMEDNQLTAGRWWTAADAGKPLVSVSSEYADALHLKVGDHLSFDVAGEPVTVEVASTRKIRWDSFKPNFFLVFPPGLLDGAAGTYMAGLFLARRSVPRWPIWCGSFRRSRYSTWMRFSNKFATSWIAHRWRCSTCFCLPWRLESWCCWRRCNRRAMSGAMKARCCAPWVQATAPCCRAWRRNSRRSVVSGTLAAFGATGVGWILARQLFSLEFTLDPWVWVTGFVCGTVLVGLSGTWRREA